MNKTIQMMVTVVTCAGLSLFSFTCSDKAFFDEGSHVWSYPRAFVYDIEMEAVSIADSVKFLKNISTPAGVPVHFFGFVTHARQGKQLEGKWAFGDGADTMDIIDISFIVKHEFANTGLYTAFFTLSEGSGNSLYDSVKITVTPPPSLSSQ
jgi:hypothetical protein